MNDQDPNVKEALRFAEDLPADCFADRCICVLAAEVLRLREEIATLRKWQADRIEAERAAVDF